MCKIIKKWILVMNYLILSHCMSSDTDHCAGNDCNGNGVCTDIIGGYVCNCYQGYDPDTDCASGQ